MSDITSSRAIEYRTLRSPTVHDTTERTVEIMVAPYGEVSPMGGGEAYAPGAFGDPGPISLKLETGNDHKGPVVGRAISWSDTPEGLVGTFKISETRDGDDALTLAADGAIGASAGFVPNRDGIAREGGINVVRSAVLHEATLTATPAYAGAGVVEVRSIDGGTMPEPTETATPEVANPDYMKAEDVQDLVTRSIDAYRSDVAAEATPTPTVEAAEHRGHEYRTIGDLIVDTIAHARGKSAEATERLTRSMDLGIVDPAGLAIQLRAFALPGNSVGAAVAPDQYIPELLELLREGRPVANLFVGRGLPALGNNIDLPAVSVGNTVDYQDGQNTGVESTTQEQILTTFPKSTIAGGQGMSVQAQQWSQPSYMQTVVTDLVSAYAEFLDGRTIAGDPAVDTPVSLTGYTGILDGATDVPVTGDHLAAIALVGTAWAAVYAGSRRAPIAAMMNSADWGAFLDLVDSDGRPVVTTEAPSNVAGFGDASSISGTFRGLPVVLDDNIVAGNVILGSFRDALLFEDSGNPAQIALTYPDVLTTDVTAFGFSALAIRRPAAFAVLSGII